ncbi:MAG: hypothetical protein LQ337_000806 [Flavoplaca oasis]|nr:MAG: hypothetical protein LQ337_000806 [Flavoplaca oasis]
MKITNGHKISQANYGLLIRSMVRGLDYCSTAFLGAGPNQVYTYLGCASADLTDYFLATPTTVFEASSMQTPASLPPTLPPTTASSTPSRLPSLPTLILPSRSIASSTSTLSPSNPDPPAPTPSNTGAIVGGVLGGLALVGFVVFAVIVLRLVKSRRGTTIPGLLSVWRTDKKKNEAVVDRGNEWAAQQPIWTNPIELDPARPPIEKPKGRQHEVPELHDPRSEAIHN